jgi:hypothetical protein
MPQLVLSILQLAKRYTSTWGGTYFLLTPSLALAENMMLISYTALQSQQLVPACSPKSLFPQAAQMTMAIARPRVTERHNMLLLVLNMGMSVGVG